VVLTSIVCLSRSEFLVDEASIPRANIFEHRRYVS